MVIGFDGSRAFQKGRTGTENYSYQLLKSLAKIDQKNQYVVYLRPGIEPGGVWPVNFQFSIINFQFLWTQVGLGWQTFKDPLDVLFVPAHTLPLFRRPGLKTVVTVHDLGSEYLPSMHQIKQRLYLGFMQKFQLKTADHIISVSKATKVDLVDRIRVRADKISVVYEGYDKGLFKPIQSDAVVNTLRGYGLKPEQYFLFVGTVQPRKNLERLIRAFSVIARSWTTKQSRSNEPHTKIATLPAVARNDDLRLVIAGSKGWLSDEIYQLPEQLGIENQVKFLGYVPESDLPALYCGAIALTFPSLFEGFGLPILEAQACGCPILTSNTSSTPEVGGKGAVYVSPYDVDDIVRGMVRIQNSEFRIQNAKAGLENVKRFSWEKCARETLEVLLSS